MSIKKTEDSILDALGVTSNRSQWLTVLRVVTILSKSFRNAMLTQLLLLENQLHIAKAALQLQVARADTISNAINELRPQLAQLLSPVDKFMQSYPLDQALAVEGVPYAGDVKKEFTKFLQSLLNNLSLSIPSWLKTVVERSALAGFSFDGINTYGDLKRKLDDLLFRSARATSLADQSAIGLAYIENELLTISIYRQIIEYLK